MAARGSATWGAEQVDEAGVLSDALEGIVLGSVILLWGPPGAGKSTLAAELGARLAAHEGGACWWLDRDQLNRSLIKGCFTRAGVPKEGISDRRLRIVSPYPPHHPKFRPISWRDAFAAVPKRAPVAVVDSLQAWAGLHDFAEQSALLRAAQALGPTVVVISEATKSGDAAGRLSNQHTGDATVTITPDLITITKCRWRSAPVQIARTPLAGPPEGPDQPSSATESKKSASSQ
jgi:predicted ATP-dependent serine protease